jgi:hypothetical protein
VAFDVDRPVPGRESGNEDSRASERDSEGPRKIAVCRSGRKLYRIEPCTTSPPLTARKMDLPSDLQRNLLESLRHFNIVLCRLRPRPQSTCFFAPMTPQGAVEGLALNHRASRVPCHAPDPGSIVVRNETN